MDSYTYMSEEWHTRSLLDNIMCTADAHDSLEKVAVLYGFAKTKHIPAFQCWQPTWLW